VTRYHLAQINIARAVADLDSSLMAGFVSRLAEINALAERAKGFVWRLQSDGGDATAIRVFDDPRTYINMSVWESPDDLKNFVYRSAHVELIAIAKHGSAGCRSNIKRRGGCLPVTGPPPRKAGIACCSCARMDRAQLHSRWPGRFPSRASEPGVVAGH
jgi:hypothetical protein